MLVDTTVWVDHLRGGDLLLTHLLEEGQAVLHPFVIGELACGHIPDRVAVMDALRMLRILPIVENGEVLAFIERHGLVGRGLGWIDVHLLASASTSNERLVTRDKRLRLAARELGLEIRLN